MVEIEQPFQPGVQEEEIDLYSLVAVDEVNGICVELFTGHLTLFQAIWLKQQYEKAVDSVGLLKWQAGQEGSVPYVGY